MKVRECPACGHKVIAKIKFCTQCGASMTGKPRQASEPVAAPPEAPPAEAAPEPSATVALTETPIKPEKRHWSISLAFWTSPLWAIGFFIWGLAKYDAYKAERQAEERRQENIARAQQIQRLNAIAAQAAADREQQAAERRAAAEQRAREEAAEAAKEAACKKDWECWADRHSLRAGVACRPHVENLAKYDFEWTDGWFEPKFPKFGASATKDSFRYVGDAIKFQNGFGAWQRYTYTCLYNVETKEVIKVSARLGRL